MCWCATALHSTVAVQQNSARLGALLQSTCNVAQVHLPTQNVCTSSAPPGPVAISRSGKSCKKTIPVLPPTLSPHFSYGRREPVGSTSTRSALSSILRACQGAGGALQTEASTVSVCVMRLNCKLAMQKSKFVRTPMAVGRNG
jgi:hypothetical protein